NSSFDPSLSLSYRLFPQKEVYLRLMAKRIFRLPTFNELYFYHIGTANLRPERASQLNLGITWKSDNQGDSRRWNASATADCYANRVTDKIVAVPFNMFVWRIANLDRATILGTDITAQATFALNTAQKLTFNGNYSLQRAMNSTVKASPTYHNQLPYTPLHTFAATLAWENPWANIAATMSGQSERWTTVDHAAGTRIDGFSVTDLSLWRTFQSKYTLRFTLQNLFDRQYDLVAHYPMPGRSWKMQFSFKM
ncbi:MAG: TonB-dependent receptor, partial [Prevotella sp.]|nr:TonB-dependent receptor [Prevotella sp.]